MSRRFLERRILGRRKKRLPAPGVKSEKGRRLSAGMSGRRAKKEKRRLWRDSRGMSLIELLISVSMAAVIMGAATLFIRRAIQSYNVATAAIDLQMEAHVLLEQMSAWVMEGNRVEVTPEQVLVIYSVPRRTQEALLPDGTTLDENGRVVPTTGPKTAEVFASKRLIWMEGDGLYMVVRQGISDPDQDTTPRPDSAEAVRENCVSQYMAEFTPQWDEDKELLTLKVKLREGTQEYAIQDEMKVRNGLSTPAPSASP